MKNKKRYAWLLAAGLLTAAPTMQAQLLKGYVQTDSVSDMQISYTLDGDMLSMVYKPIEPAADGSFSFDLDLPEGALDVTIGADMEVFGAHLETGKQVVIYLEPSRTGHGLEARFEGDDTGLSRFYNRYVQAFDIMKYFSPDPAESKPIAEYRRILEDEYAALKEMLPLIEDEKLRSYYARLSEGMYTWSKLRIIMDQAYEEKKNNSDYAEYNEAIAKVDPNDPMNIRTNMLFSWLGAQAEVPYDFENDMTPLYLAEMDVVEKRVTNPDVRFVLTRYIAYTFFSFAGGRADVPAFWQRYQTFAKDYPELIAEYELKVKAATGTAKGCKMPYDPLLTRPDETTCRLSDLCDGLPVYIDVWATWCGPCCKEIPHLEKVVEQLKGQGKVRIVSISVDQNRGAWLKKLEKDQPAWEQYILTPEEEKKFMAAWGIGGIPRFILLDKEGRIFSADALRPSDEKLMELFSSIDN